MGTSMRQVTRSGDDFKEDSPARSIPVIRIVARRADTDIELLRVRRMIRLDALKALIGTLLEQMDDFTEAPHDESASILQSMVREFETELIRRALIRTGGKQRAAARLLGEKKTTLNAKIIRYGIGSDGLIVKSRPTTTHSAPPSPSPTANGFHSDNHRKNELA